MASRVRSGRSAESNRGGGVGGAPPPRSGCAEGFYPTPSHFATQLSSDVPLNLSDFSLMTGKRRVCGGLAVGRGVGRTVDWAHDSVQSGGLNGVLPLSGRLPTLGGSFRRRM